QCYWDPTVYQLFKLWHNRPLSTVISNGLHGEARLHPLGGSGNADDSSRVLGNILSKHYEYQRFCRNDQSRGFRLASWSVHQFQPWDHFSNRWRYPRSEEHTSELQSR